MATLLCHEPPLAQSLMLRYHPIDPTRIYNTVPGYPKHSHTTPQSCGRRVCLKRSRGLNVGHAATYTDMVWRVEGVTYMHSPGGRGGTEDASNKSIYDVLRGSNRNSYTTLYVARLNPTITNLQHSTVRACALEIAFWKSAGNSDERIS